MGSGSGSLLPSLAAPNPEFRKGGRRKRLWDGFSVGHVQGSFCPASSPSSNVKKKLWMIVHCPVRSRTTEQTADTSYQSHFQVLLHHQPQRAFSHRPNRQSTPAKLGASTTLRKRNREAVIVPSCRQLPRHQCPGRDAAATHTTIPRRCTAQGSVFTNCTIS